MVIHSYNSRTQKAKTQQLSVLDQPWKQTSSYIYIYIYIVKKRKQINGLTRLTQYITDKKVS